MKDNPGNYDSGFISWKSNLDDNPIIVSNPETDGERFFSGLGIHGTPESGISNLENTTHAVPLLTVRRSLWLNWSSKMRCWAVGWIITMGSKLWTWWLNYTLVMINNYRSGLNQLNHYLYPLVMINIAIENGHLKLISLWKTVIFHSHVNVYQMLLHLTVILWIIDIQCGSFRSMFCHATLSGLDSLSSYCLPVPTNSMWVCLETDYVYIYI